MTVQPAAPNSLDFGVFSFTTPNLGDEMQSYAVLGHVNRVSRFLDRDRLAWYGGPMTDAVFNSYFYLGNGFGNRLPVPRQFARPPAPAIRPIWHGFHVGREELLHGRWAEYLRRNGPIGCRDLYSVRRLQAIGVDAYFSGCLTLFLGRVFPHPAEPRRGIYFVDLSPEAERLIPKEIASQAKRLTTYPPGGMQYDALGRWSVIAELLQKLASAELVVTRRLHVALPCVGFGTPVVVMPNTAFPGIHDRMSGYESVMKIVYPDNAQREVADIDWSNPPRGQVLPEIEVAYERLTRQLGDRGLLASALTSDGSLDRTGLDRIRIRNTLDRRAHGVDEGRIALGSVRLRLGSRTFPVQVRFWTDAHLDLALGSFPGLSRFDLQVEATAKIRSSKWIPCGSLRDLAI